MRTTIITTLSGFQQCRLLYDNILSQFDNGDDNVFLLYKWQEIWFETYKSSASPLVIVIFDGDTPLAIFPFCLRKKSKWGIPYQYVEYAAAGLCNYSDFIISPSANSDDILKILLHILLDLWKPWWLYLDFPPLVSNSSNTVSLLGSLASSSLITEKQVTSAPFIKIEGDWDWYFKTIIHKSLRGDLNRQTNKASRKFGEAILEDASPEEVEHFFEMHVKEWGLRGERSQYLDQKNREFEKTLIDNFEYTDFTRLRFGKEIVAYHLGYKYKGHFCYFRPAFQIQFSDFSPGKLLLAKLIQRETERKGKIFDLGRGQNEYKSWFGNDELPIITLRIYKNSLVPGTLLPLVKIMKHGE